MKTKAGQIYFLLAHEGNSATLGEDEEKLNGH
jgi:hypothetical protein